MPSATDETAEALCGALYYNEYQHTGEQQVRSFDGVRLWSCWVIGDVPHDMRIIVKRDDPFVVVTVNWRILAAPKIVKASIDFRIDCSPDRNRVMLEESTQDLMTKLLEMYRDVLEGTGYASVGYLAANRKP